MHMKQEEPSNQSKWQDRIAFDSTVLAGKPVIKGTRIAVEFIIDLLSQGWSNADIAKNYPNVSDDDVRACLAYARDTLSAERVYPIGA
jgi:uncharacterized protein (DUF433 family)